MPVTPMMGNHLGNLLFLRWSTMIKIWPTVKSAMSIVYLKIFRAGV